MNPIWFSDPDGDDPCSDGGDGDGCDGANKKNKLSANKGGFKGKGKQQPKLKVVNNETLTVFGFGKAFGPLKTNKSKSKQTQNAFKEGVITLEATSNVDEGDGGDRFTITAGRGRKKVVLFDEVLKPQEDNLTTETFEIPFKLDKKSKINIEVTNDKNEKKSPSAFFGKIFVKKSESKPK
jgi:hypothetical protein